VHVIVWSRSNPVIILKASCFLFFCWFLAYLRTKVSILPFFILHDGYLTCSGFSTLVQKGLEQLPEHPIVVFFGPQNASVIRVREFPSQFETVLDFFTPPAHGQSLFFN
jgi:hypothetical protein